ncbi:MULTISPECIES: phage tail protein [Yersinia]|uniref:phage tail protein n=1 Tax=Yersinia TaxID=629 RepID=UPI0021691AFA|nr:MULTISPECIES: phage tail protein [Yersinia]MDN0096173.1 phage tail protein [Yersinia rohdei]
MTTQPQDADIAAGDTLSLTVAATASNGSALSYQWQKDTVSIVGATSTTYEKNNTVIADAGDYRVLISSVGLSSITSEKATVSIN